MPFHRDACQPYLWLLVFFLVLLPGQLRADDSQAWLLKGEQQLKLNNDDEAIYWLEKAAAQHNAKAQQLLGHYYAGQQEWQKAIFYQLQQALDGNTQALIQLGQWLSVVDPKTLIDLDWTEVLYRLASDSNPQAEPLYNQWLEQKFNQQRSAQLDSEIQSQIAPVAAPNPRPIATPLSFGVWLPLASFALFVVLAFLFWRVRRQRRTAPSVPTTTTDHEQQLIKQKRLLLAMKSKITELQKELEHQKSQASPHPLSEAYALLGFDQQDALTLQQLKARYKILAKIHHPDCGGSERHMQKLNQAVKTLAHHLKSTSVSHR